MPFILHTGAARAAFAPPVASNSEPASAKTAPLMPRSSGTNGQREADLRRRRPVGLAAQRIVVRRRDIARTVAGTVEAADRLATLEEEVEQADVLAAPALDVTADGAADEA